MQTDFNLNNNNVNFKALYMPKPRKLSSLKNTYYSDLLEMVREPLEKMAQDVDIYVKPKGIFRKGFDIRVGEVTKNPIKRFFGLIGSTTDKKIRYNDFLTFNGDIPSLILQNVKDAKEDFISFKDYLTKS